MRRTITKTRTIIEFDKTKIGTGDFVRVTYNIPVGDMKNVQEFTGVVKEVFCNALVLVVMDPRNKKIHDNVRLSLSAVNPNHIELLQRAVFNEIEK